MLNNKKSIMKSVRLTEEVYNYVDNFEGDGFNQKLENLVLFCMKKEDTLRDRISYYENKLISAQKYHAVSTEGMNEIKKMMDLIDKFNFRMDKVLDRMSIDEED